MDHALVIQKEKDRNAENKKSRKGATGQSPQGKLYSAVEITLHFNFHSHFVP